MTPPTPDKIRNVALISHGGAGKTSLAEAMLFDAGVTTRMGHVEEGNTVTDYDEDEIKRQISVSAALAPLEWNGTKINVHGVVDIVRKKAMVWGDGKEPTVSAVPADMADAVQEYRNTLIEALA